MTKEELEECPFFDDDEDDNIDDYPRYRTDLLDDPRKIYNYLLTKVYNQNAACKAASIILYNAVHGIKGNSRNLFCGPPGSGKTYIWQIIRDEIYPHIIITNAARITQEGWSGSHKVTSPLHRITETHKPYVIVYDEFDKLCRPKISRGNENTSEIIQAEFLALIQPSDRYMIVKDSPTSPERIIDLELISWVFAGSFAIASERESEKSSCSGLGFTAVRKEAKAFDEELTIQTLLDFGLIPELASRLTRMINLHPMDIEQYRYLILQHEGSPIRTLESNYGLAPGFILENVLNETDVEPILKFAFDHSLGVRSCTAQIQSKLDDYLFEHHDEVFPFNSYE